MESSLNGPPPRSLIKIRPIRFVPEKSSREVSPMDILLYPFQR